MKERKIKRQVDCELSNTELKNYGEKLASLTIEKIMKEEEKKKINKEKTDEITTLSSEILKLSNVLKSKKEVKTLECIEKIDYDSNKIIIIRVDTGDIIEEKPIPNSYLQEDFFDQDEIEIENV